MSESDISDFIERLKIIGNLSLEPLVKSVFKTVRQDLQKKNSIVDVALNPARTLIFQTFVLFVAAIMFQRQNYVLFLAVVLLALGVLSRVYQEKKECTHTTKVKLALDTAPLVKQVLEYLRADLKKDNSTVYLALAPVKTLLKQIFASILVLIITAAMLKRINRINTRGK
tara:strand:- start:1855 stop:2364 length:510 start_codon:yes stop_codon:yes gene_type:complete